MIFSFLMAKALPVLAPRGSKLKARSSQLFISPAEPFGLPICIWYYSFRHKCYQIQAILHPAFGNNLDVFSIPAGRGAGSNKFFIFKINTICKNKIHRMRN
jgi:hypothetical protein